MKPAGLAFALAVPLLVAGCGVPDIIAHGVKSYEHSQKPNNSQAVTAQPEARQSTQPSAAPVASGTTANEPEPVSGPVPPREQVTAEPLK